MELKDKVIAEIKKIYDPEIPVNIYDLGLIYNVKVDKENVVEIKMTLTTPNCPVAESLPKEVEDSVKGCLLYTSPSPRDISGSRMPSSA